MKINVTETHIKEGQYKDCTECPIALAIEEQLHPGFSVIVYAHKAAIVDRRTHTKRHEVTLPQIGQDFIRKYDAAKGTGHYDPFSMDVNVPEGYQQR